MTVSVLMIVEGSSPEISRCVNVEEDITLGELSQIIDAALGFSGAATHLFVGQHGTTRDVFAEVPGLDERDEDEMLVGDMEPMTYVYDPSANWNIHVELLGPSQLEGPTPMLVDAAGPDVVEACSGPEMMTQFRAEARRLAAGVEPDLEVIPLMFSFLPVMAPERVLDRLTVADPVSVATRIGYVAEELFFDQAAAAAEEDPQGRGLADHFDAFLHARPELREVLDVDPHPERNPTLISAVTEFFDELLGDGPGDPAVDLGAFPGFDALDETRDEPTAVEIFTLLLKLFRRPVPFADEFIRDESTAEMVRALLQFQDDDAVAAFLIGTGLVEEHPGELVLSELGKKFFEAEDPIAFLAEPLRLGWEHLLGADYWRELVEFLADVRDEPPEWFGGGLVWLEMFYFAVLVSDDPADGGWLTDEGEKLIGLMLDAYRAQD